MDDKQRSLDRMWEQLRAEAAAPDPPSAAQFNVPTQHPVRQRFLTDKFQSAVLSGLFPALGLLKADDRNILILREVLELSYEEISLALRLPIGTVRSRLHYGRKKLAELLKVPRE